VARIRQDRVANPRLLWHIGIIARKGSENLPAFSSNCCLIVALFDGIMAAVQRKFKWHVAQLVEQRTDTEHSQKRVFKLIRMSLVRAQACQQKFLVALEALLAMRRICNPEIDRSIRSRGTKEFFLQSFVRGGCPRPGRILGVKRFDSGTGYGRFKSYPKD